MTDWAPYRSITIDTDDLWVLYDICLDNLDMLPILLPNYGDAFNQTLPYDRDSIFHLVLRTPANRFRNDKKHVVKTLLLGGADPLISDRLGDTILHFLAGSYEEESHNLLHFLLEGEGIESEDIRSACRQRLYQQNYYGNTALIVAVLYNQLSCAKLLLRYGADDSIRGEYEMTALEFAEWRHNTEMARTLHATKKDL